MTYRKLTFNTAIVTTTESVTSIIVKSRYFPNNGTVKDVGGIISTSSKKNTVSDSKMLIHNDIFSPLSEGKQKTSTDNIDMPTHGIIKLTV